MKKCKVCNLLKSIQEFPRQQMNKDGHGKTCIHCLMERKKTKPGTFARKILKDLKTEQKKRPKTPQQIRRIESEKELSKIKKEMFSEMLEEKGYYYCQLSGRTAKKSDLSVHHIVFRSELRGHPQVHNKKNLIIVLDPKGVCDEENNKHRFLHNKKSRRIHLVKERNLEELFGTRISFYQNI